MAIEDLERELQASWDRDHLAVYGDFLQAHGDPRGELIAIDLAGAPEHLANRRFELVHRWLGDPTRTGLDYETSFGFVDQIIAREPQNLANVTTPYVRGILVAETRAHIAAGVVAIGTRPWPWLERLAIRHRDDIPRSPIVTRAHASALIAATPRLTTLDVDGRRVFGAAFVHPTVRRLAVAGYDALGSLSGTGPAHENVDTLDFAFHRDATLDHLPEPPPELVRGVLPVARLPALRSLDLSRNEPGSHGPNHLGGSIDVFDWLRASSLRPTRLRLPSLRIQGHADALVAIMARAPGLELAIARAYRTGPEPPPGVTLPPTQPWPARDQVHGRDALAIRTPGEPYAEYLDLSGPVGFMERHFDSFTPACKAAWTELWDFIDDLGWEDADGNDISMDLPTIVLQEALEPLDLGELRRWSEMRDVLRKRAATLPDTVSVKRYWGW